VTHQNPPHTNGLLRRLIFDYRLPDRNSRSYDFLRNVVPRLLVLMPWALLIISVFRTTISQITLISLIATELIGLSWLYALELGKRVVKPGKTIFADTNQRIQEIRQRLTASSYSNSISARQELYNTLLEIINNTSAILSAEVYANCAVCIKLLKQESEGNVEILTLLRDSRSQPVRGPNDSVAGFPIEANTAFDTVLFDPKSDGYYSKDDLRSLAATGNYVNANERWRELYNATAVIALPMTYPKSGNVIGFLCADCWFGMLSGERVRSILENTAKQVYNVLQLVLLPQQEIYDRDIGWRPAPSGLPRLTASQPGTHDMLERLLSLRAAGTLSNQQSGQRPSSITPSQQALEGFLGEESLRASTAPPERVDAVGKANFDPDTIDALDDRERELLSALKRGVSSQEFFPTEVNLAQAIWEVNRFLCLASDDEIEQASVDNLGDDRGKLH
jgi:hypothetical protein